MLVMLLAVAMRRCEAAGSSEHFDKNWVLTLITFVLGVKNMLVSKHPETLWFLIFFFNYSPVGISKG